MASAEIWRLEGRSEGQGAKGGPGCRQAGGEWDADAGLGPGEMPDPNPDPWIPTLEMAQNCVDPMGLLQLYPG